MIRILWFMIKVAILVGVSVWIAQRPGVVEIDWLGYHLTMHIGIFFILALAAMLLTLFLYRTIRTFVDFPRSYRRYQEIKNHEKGYRALTLGLTAVAAGDTKAALHQSKRAKTLLPAQESLPLLLEAQAARLEGREEDAAHIFLELLEHKDAAFLGMRGLLQGAIDRGDTDEALELGQKALKLHPKQKWILRLVYDLEIQAKNWDKAQNMLPRLQKSKALSAAKIKSDHVAFLLLKSDKALSEGARIQELTLLQKAYKIDKYFTPIITRLINAHKDQEQLRKARTLIEKTWKIAPHPELATLWEGLIPAKKARASLGALRWAEKLAALNPDHAQSQIILGRAAMAEKLWGEARDHLNKAIEMDERAGLCHLYADLEKQAGSAQGEIEHWEIRAENALDDERWVCRETGLTYQKWSPLAQPHGRFNTMIWGAPDDHHNATAPLLPHEDIARLT